MIWGMGANMAMRRRMLDDIVGFDEALGGGAPLRSSQDFDFSLRAYRAGYAILLDHRVTVDHYGSRTPEQWPATQRNYGIGDGAFYSKHVRCGDLLALRLLLRQFAWVSRSWVVHSCASTGRCRQRLRPQPRHRYQARVAVRRRQAAPPVRRDRSGPHRGHGGQRRHCRAGSRRQRLGDGSARDEDEVDVRHPGGAAGGGECQPVHPVVHLGQRHAHPVRARNDKPACGLLGRAGCPCRARGWRWPGSR